MTCKSNQAPLYLGVSVYENDTLRFLAHEEGRVRYKGADSSFSYDYFIKDHLGNVRMVLTEEQRTDAYPVASMETGQATTEEALYSNISQTRVDKPAGYPTDTYTTPNDKVARVRGDGQKIGPAITLKVMAGDQVNIRANSWYKLNGITPNSPVSPLTDLVAALTNSVAMASGKVTAGELANSGILTPNATAFLTTQNGYTSAKPKAFVNWLLLDEQFHYVSSSSGAEQVGSDQELKTHLKNSLPIEKNGYLYIYVSNETPNIDVFFDNLQVSHVRGPLLEESHYYPFGLTMQGISSKAAGGLENKKEKFQGQEFTTDLGIDMYEFKYRMDDPQIGRFWQIDPLANDYVYNSTYAFSENHVTTHVELEGLEKVTIHQEKKPLTDKLPLLPPSLPTSLKPRDNSDNQRSSPQGNNANSQSSSKGDGMSLVGRTITTKGTKEVDIINSGVGDKITVSSSQGKSAGSSGYITLDHSSTVKNGVEYDGGSIQVAGVVTLGYSKDGSISMGVGALGAEGHVSYSAGNGSLIGVTLGGSYTNDKGEVSGHDVSIKAGGYTAAAAAVYLSRGAILPVLPLLFK